MKAKRSLGQNFLNDDTVLRRTAAALGASDTDTIVEIGPGRGALTEKLLETGASVVALEIDRDLIPVLRTRFHFDPKITIVEGDVMTADLGLLSGDPDGKVKIAGNLPYYISTPILQRLIEQIDRFTVAILMLQREVAERIMAAPGNADRGFLTVLAEDAFEIEKICDVGPEAFTPRPKVWSSVVRLTPKANRTSDPRFRQLASWGFQQKRKTIFNNLKAHLPGGAASELLKAAGIDPGRRAETLTLEDWRSLAEKI